MAYDEKTKTASKPHGITLENRCKLLATGVEDVESFDETAVIMSTTQGTLIVRGSGLHMGKLSLDAGELGIEGMICDISYEEKPSGSVWSRLFG